jgi:hypothetical protein
MGEMTSIWGLVTANKANLRGLSRPADAIFSLIRRMAMEDSWPSPARLQGAQIGRPRV